MDRKHTTAVWAHRGFSYAFPENTRAAFLAALELGVDGLEFDIHLTKDGQMVVIHDEHLERTTNGHGLVAEHTLAELRGLDAGSWFSPAFAGEPIPTLEEVLDLVLAWDKPVKVNIEIKSGVVQYPELERLAFELVEAKGLTHRVLFSSFNHFVLRDLKQVYPQAQIGLLYVEGLVDPWRYAEWLQAGALHPYHLSFDESVVADAHAHGIAVNTYTVNEQQDMSRLVAWNVDAVITDRPDVLLGMPHAFAR